MSTSWVAEIVFKSSTYKLIKYYYSENEGAFEINKDGITNKNGSFKYEIVDTQSGGEISFKEGENTTSTYTKLFFVIYDGSTEFAKDNIIVRECTSATNNGSYTYDGLKGNSLTSIKFTNMKADRSKLNAITSVVVPAAETQAAPESSAAQEKIPVASQKSSVEVPAKPEEEAKANPEKKITESITESITDRIEIKSYTLNDIVTNKIYLKGEDNEKATILKFFKPTIPIKYMESSKFYNNWVQKGMVDDETSERIGYSSTSIPRLKLTDAIGHLNNNDTASNEQYLGLDLKQNVYIATHPVLIADIILPISFTAQDILKLVYGSIDDPENFNINITNGVMSVNKQ